MVSDASSVACLTKDSLSLGPKAWNLEKHSQDMQQVFEHNMMSQFTAVTHSTHSTRCVQGWVSSLREEEGQNHWGPHATQ